MNKKLLVVVVVLLLLLGVAYVKRRGIMRVLTGGQSQQTMMTQPTQQSVSPTNSVASGSAVFMVKTDPKLGSYLTDPKGMTLYTYAKDQPGVSNCTGQCQSNWPAYSAQNPPAQLPPSWGVMKKADGNMQYTYKNMPLYYYSGDKAPGDTNGNGVGNNWWVAKQ